MADQWITIVGLEVHVQLSTQTKLFCRCSTEFGQPPNTSVCPVCMGHPGSLPVLNRHAIDLAITAGLGMNCHIAQCTKWDRKNYFYPDLPKGYQISQFDLPICGGGFLEIETPTGKRQVRLVRAHLEEDAGKSSHDEQFGAADSRIDLNRTGTPLLEIVTEPDMRSAGEAKQFLVQLRTLLEYLQVSDCNMQEGSLRVDANVNLHIPSGGKTVETPIVEVKNLNSFRAVERAIEYEEQRQFDAYRKDGQTRQNTPKRTVGWDDAAGRTMVQREKEDSADYRYFPDPDLIPVVIEAAHIERLAVTLGELPEQRRQRYISELGLRAEDAAAIIQQGRGAVDFFERVLTRGGSVRRAAAWMLQDVLRTLNEQGIGIADFPVSAERLGDLVAAIDGSQVDSARGREVFQYMADHPEADVAAAIEGLGITVVAADELEGLVRQLLEENPDVVAKVRGGNTKAVGALVGQARKRNANADPRAVQDIAMRLIEAS